MGFSIGKFIGSIAPFVGGAIAGPIGAVLGAGISSGFGSSAPAPAPAPIPARAVTPQGPQFAPSSLTSVAPTPNPFNVQRRRVATFLPAAGRAAAAGGIGGAIVSMFGGGGESVGDILRQARETFGRGVTKNKIINAAKFCGIESAADTFGISDTQLCKVIVSGRTRRRRGISAADIRRTRRTLRTVKSIRADLKSIRL